MAAKDQPTAERQADGVSAFCQQHDISRATLYNLWRAGKGPAYFKVGARTLISRSAAARWRAEREAATEAKGAT